MITKDNFKCLVKTLGYVHDSTRIDDIWTKKFHIGDSDEFKIEIDFTKSREKILYPTEDQGMTKDQGMKIHRETTTNFSHNENFVVFECVNRLFQLGYLPKHIELELIASLGRGKGKLVGYADIFVKNNKGHPFLLIECKTAGKEYSDEWKNVLHDGGQLFSYNTVLEGAKGEYPALCLYCSDYTDNQELVREYHTIVLQDNKQYLEQNSRLKSYAKSNSRELFNVWKDTYGQDFVTNQGLFEDDIGNFKIGQRKITYSDIKGNLINKTKKYHEFRSILRKHNVSGRENAFDKLLNLLLCKVVDEKQSQKYGSELKFYWKGIAFDSQLSLVDRLQKLYRDGMKEYLGEDVTYIEETEIDNAFDLFKNEKDATKSTIKKFFDELKYYSNNYFAFIDVYNQELFAKNFAVLVEMVKMWQDLPLTNEARDQFLGDLFEMLLDQGVKQSEGQFFTPLPIVRFIVSSLPLGKIVSQDKSIPKALDYACGAGHFLNEYAAQIGHWVSGPKLSDMFKQIYGIEKESRLAKVSKVAALMYGQNDIQIKFADALTEIDGIKENSFSVLIANPPYSVKGFLETLTDEEKNKFTLSRTVNNISTNSSIECFFIERAAQLLKTGGVAGIVLPSTVLTKSNEAVYSEAQKILLKNFDIIAVFDAGTGVFGKTGTQTVTLFLRKKSNEPNLFEHYTNRVVSWYKSDFKKDELFEDKDKLVQFAHLVIDGDVSEVDKVKCVLSDTKYKKRLVYYLLTRYQSEEVLIIKAPDDNSERKKFLGYEWTKRKGSEGIQYLSDRNDVGSIETPMFDPGNLFDLTDKLNGLIRDNFNRKLNITEIPESLRQFVTVTPLSQLLNFKDDSFKTAIYLNNARFDDGGPQIRWNTEYQLVKLSTVITECPKSLISVRDAEENTSGQYPFYTSGINIYRYDKHLVDGENLYIADGGKFSCHYYKGKAAYSSHTYVIKAKDNTIMNKYLYILLNQNAQFITDNYFTGSGLKNLQKQKFATFLIPLPPIEIQQKIVGEYEKIEQQQSAAQQNIENANSRMSSIMDEISGGGGAISS